MNLTDKEAKLVAAVLDMAAEVFSNHGCNDFVISDYTDMSPEEMREIDCDIHKWNGDPQEHDPSGDHDYQNDWCLMNYFAARLRGECGPNAS